MFYQIKMILSVIRIHSEKLASSCLVIIIGNHPAPTPPSLLTFALPHNHPHILILLGSNNHPYQHIIYVPWLIIILIFIFFSNYAPTSFTPLTNPLQIDPTYLISDTFLIRIIEFQTFVLLQQPRLSNTIILLYQRFFPILYPPSELTSYNCTL